MTLPPGPTQHPFFQVLQWIARPFDLLDRCAQRYGDPFTLRLGQLPPLVFVTNPQAIQQIFAATAEQLDAGVSNGILRPMVGANSLLLLDGDRHQRQRRLLTPPFHGDRMRAYGQLICEVSQQATQNWQVGQPVVIRSVMQEISLRVILQAVFGLHEGDRYEQLRLLLSQMLHFLGTPLSSSLLFIRSLQRDWGPWSPWGRFTQKIQQIDQLLYAEIRDRQAQPNEAGTDILSLLLSARDEADQPMTEEELRDELITLLVAGHETTASALAWAFYWIHTLPEVREKLVHELDTVNPVQEPMAIAQLPYLNAVCQETLRIYPITPITTPRVVRSSFQLMGYELSAGTLMSPCIYLMHQRPDLYPQPQQFRPERFLERQFAPYEYLPFGGGNRRCIGLAFAQFEMKLVLATILQQWQLTLAEQRPVQPSRRGVTFAPGGGVPMVPVAMRQVQPALAQI